MSAGNKAKPTIKIKVERNPQHAYVTFHGKSHDGDTFAFGGQICLNNGEADVLLANINRNSHVIVEDPDHD